MTLSDTQKQKRLINKPPVNRKRSFNPVIVKPDFIMEDQTTEKQPQKPCEFEDCDKLGDPYVYPEYTKPGDPDRIMDPEEGSTHYYCANHAGSEGFCIGCGGFWGGVDSFEFGGQICSDCRDDFREELREEDDDDEDWYSFAEEIKKDWEEERDYIGYLGE